MNSLNAVSPIDGRYRGKCEPLAKYFSEGALIKYRVRVEVEYFIALSEQLKGLRPQLAAVASKAEELRDIYRTFSDADAQAIKDIEKVTNHDVKAVEYFLKGKFDEMGLAELKEFIHFGLTSQDINNTSVPLSMKECHDEVLLPAYKRLQAMLDERAEEWKDIPMLAHTHGQPASPTTLGKEWGVFAYRLRRQIEELERIPFTAKFGGATGNFNAHLAAFPEVDWRAFGNDFVANHLGLERQQLTTQIENYDMMAAWFDACKRINVILIDLCRDVWTYVSMEYFKQKIKAGEVGSSAMPHKVNPIDFENAEGNLGLANAIFEHLSHKLPHAARPYGQHGEPQHRRADSTHHDFHSLAGEGTRQAAAQRAGPGARPGEQLGCCSRSHTDNTAQRGLPQPLRGAEAADTHQRKGDGGHHRELRGYA